MSTLKRNQDIKQTVSSGRNAYEDIIEPRLLPLIQNQESVLDCHPIRYQGHIVVF